MALDVATPATSPASGNPAASTADVDPDQPNGQHHLLRHVLSPQQCGSALRHFGTADSKAAARMVNRMSQRELRDMFAKVYSVTTNSNNNTWLRRKLLEAVGASRRFYAAASKTGPRAKSTRRLAAAVAAPAPASDGSNGHASSGSSGSRAATRHGSPATLALPAASYSAAHTHNQPQQNYHQHHSVLPALALPAGSPRALSLRLRAARSHQLTAAPGLASQDCGASVAAQQQQEEHQPPHRLPKLMQRFPALHRQHSSEEETCSDHSGSGWEAMQQAHHPRALAPHDMCADAGSPTSALALAAAARHHAWVPAATGPFVHTFGSNSSLASSQFPAPHALSGTLLPGPAGFAAPLSPPPQPGAHPASPTWEPNKSLARIPSITSLSALLSAYPPTPSAASEQASAPAPAACCLPAVPSMDLGLGLLSAMDASTAMLAPPSAASLSKPKLDAPREDWLTWDDWQLPPLF